MKKQISVTARVCGISAKTCSLTLPSYFPCLGSSARYSIPDKCRQEEGQLPSLSSQSGVMVAPQEGQAVSQVAKDVFQEDCVSLLPLSPTSKSEALLQVQQAGCPVRLILNLLIGHSSHAGGARCEDQNCQCPSCSAHSLSGGVPLGEVSPHSQFQCKGTRVLSRGKGRLHALPKETDFICNRVGRTPCLWTWRSLWRSIKRRLGGPGHKQKGKAPEV